MDEDHDIVAPEIPVRVDISALLPRSGIYSTNDTKTFSKETHMPQQTTQRATDLHFDPSNETIRLGPLAVRFLLTGDLDYRHARIRVYCALIPQHESS